MNFIDKVIPIAKSAGELIEQQYRVVTAYDAKGKHDIVTRADHASESLIIKHLQAKFPDYGIISEETGSLNGESDYCWIVDPLDGTSNFMTGNPYFSVSIGLAHREEMIMGVVYNPISKELFYAEKGSGAWLDGGRIAVSERNELSEAFIALAFAAEEDQISDGISLIGELALKARRIVVNFAPALDLCNISRGRLDALIDNGSTPEDHAAASLILSEAGGVLRNYDRPGWNVNITGILASNVALHEDLLSILAYRV